jgi:ubiquinone/menaquinone biosynthesis C-methylase UbiE
MEQQTPLSEQVSTETAISVPVKLDGWLPGISKDISSRKIKLEIPYDAALDDKLQELKSVEIRLPALSKVTALIEEVKREKARDGKMPLTLKVLEISRSDHEKIGGLAGYLKAIDPAFSQSTVKLREYIEGIKLKCDLFDMKLPDPAAQVVFLKETEAGTYKKLDEDFEAIWVLYNQTDRPKQAAHQQYFLYMFYDLIGEPVEVNRHIYHKPLGYSGDFITMNYIYDYRREGSYLGKSSFEKLFNRYTCTIAVSKSNVARKEYLKEELKNLVGSGKGLSILSIGCGPLREVTELISEGRITAPVRFKGVDFEPRATEYAKQRLEALQLPKGFTYDFILENVVALVRKGDNLRDSGPYDLIYVSGVFDYLPDRLASALVTQLFQMLVPGGKLICVNASLEAESHRAYYELLGEWRMHHRNRSDLLKWTQSLGGAAACRFEDSSVCPNYHILNVTKS